jgi:hypothetical protein
MNLASRSRRALSFTAAASTAFARVKTTTRRPDAMAVRIASSAVLASRVASGRS